MAQAEEEGPIVVIGEAAGAATFLLQKLNEYLGSSLCLNWCVRKQLKKLKGKVEQLQKQIVQAEIDSSSCYNHDDEASISNQTLQLQEALMREAKETICNIEDGIDQIMTIQGHRSNILGLRWGTFELAANCYAGAKKHLAVICHCFSLKKYSATVSNLGNRFKGIGEAGEKSEQNVSETDQQQQAEHGADSAALGLQEKTMSGLDSSQLNELLNNQDVHNQYLIEDMTTDRGIDLCHEDAEDDIYLEIILKFLRRKGNPLKMIVLSGSAGIGKTFLVSKAWDKFREWNGVERAPFRAAWISYDPCPMTNLLNLYEQLCLTECRFAGIPNYASQQMKREDLENKIKSFLSEKWYNIIVDDVPDVQQVWDSIQSALPPPEEKNGKLILVTRNIDSAEAFSEIPRFHIRLQKLEEGEALALFEDTALQKMQELHVPTPGTDLKKVAKDIVRYCGGRPLPVVAAAAQIGTLGTHPNVRRVLLRNLLKQHSLPESHEADALMLCYNSLCFPLKCILLYCCFLTKDSEIAVRKLARLCAAEGFVADHGSTTAEEAANDYAKNLIEWRLIGKRVLPEKPDNFRVKVGEKVRQFVAHLVDDEIYRRFGQSRERKSIRRLSITSNNIPESSRDAAFLRSCFVAPATEIEPAKLRELLIGGHRLVRVLDFTGAKRIKNLPDHMGDLVHLRYLGLRGTGISRLPGSLSRLPNLESLDIRETEVKSCPAAWQGKFRHLHLAGSFGRKVVHLQLSKKHLNLPHIQTLSGARATRKVLSKLGEWTRLRKLSIGWVRGDCSAKLCACIGSLQSLQSLTVKAKGAEILHLAMDTSIASLKTLKIGGRIQSLPQLRSHFPSLTRLYLWDSRLDKDPLESLQGLDGLVILCLTNAYVGSQMICGAGWLPNLRKLSVQRMENLEKLEIHEEGMKRLEIFFVGYCPRLKPLYKAVEEDLFDNGSHLRHLTNLRLVQITRMPSNYIGRLLSDHAKITNPYSIHVFPFPDEYQRHFQELEEENRRRGPVFGLDLNPICIEQIKYLREYYPYFNPR